jgi:hypothetical protein
MLVGLRFVISKLIDEDVDKPVDVVPISLGQASWLGLRLGAKWGDRAGLAVAILLAGLVVVAIVDEAVSEPECLGGPSIRSWIVVWARMLGLLVATYAVICTSSSVAGAFVSSFVHMLYRIGRTVMRR